MAELIILIIPLLPDFRSLPKNTIFYLSDFLIFTLDLLTSFFISTVEFISLKGLKATSVFLIFGLFEF